MSANNWPDDLLVAVSNAKTEEATAEELYQQFANLIELYYGLEQKVCIIDGEV